MTAEWADRAVEIEEELEVRRVFFSRRFSRFIAWGAAALSLGALALWLLFPLYVQLLPVSFMLGSMAMSAWAYPWFDAQGRGREGIGLTLCILIATCVLGFVLVPAAGLGAVSGFIVVITTGYLGQGERAGSLWIGASAPLLLGATAVANLKSPDWFTPLPGALGLTAELLFAAIPFLVAAIMIRVVALEQLAFFRQSRLAHMELADSARAEQQQHERLQQANREVEARIEAERQQREQMQDLLHQVRNAAHRLKGSAAAILAATTEQAAGASDQARAIGEASATIGEVRILSEQTAEHASAVARSAEQVRVYSEGGQQAVADTIHGMKQVKRRVESLAANITTLSEQSEAVGAIIASLEEIATQSDVLAINAAVEAARAGHAGRGFAVIAREVRDLAKMSRTATAQAEGLLGQIQDGVNTAVSATSDGLDGTEAGMVLAGEAGMAIQRVAQSVIHSSVASQEISTAATQQQAGMEDIASAMEHIRRVTASSVAGAQHAERAAADLDDLAGVLRELVERYHASDDQRAVSAA